MSSILPLCHLQNFDLEKKEENSETDEDGLKAESPELVWQMLFALLVANQLALSMEDRARFRVHVWKKQLFRQKKKKVSFINVSLSMADVVFSQIFSRLRPGGLLRSGDVYHVHLLYSNNETYISYFLFVRLWSFN